VAGARVRIKKGRKNKEERENARKGRERRKGKTAVFKSRRL